MEDFMSITAPKIVTRTEWGARSFKGNPVRQPGYKFLTLHHAAGFSASDLDEGKTQVKAIQLLHQDDNGWSDIGYHYLIDAAGNIYQSRPYIDNAPLSNKPDLAVGAHAAGHNSKNIGVCLLGCFHPESNASTCNNVLTQAVSDSLVQLFTFFCQEYGISPANINGHEHFSQTACPGSNLIARLPEIRLLVQEVISGQTPGAGEGAAPGATPASVRWTKALQQASTTGASARTARQDGLQPGVDASHQMAKTDLRRVLALKSVFETSGQVFDVPPALLAAIASRESRCGNVLAADGTGDRGNGFGIMQVDKRFHRIAAGGPKSQAHVDQATGILVEFRRAVQRKHQDWSDANVLKGAAVAYNSGVGNVQTIGGMDLGTTGNDYGSDVIARAQFYLQHF